MCETDLRMRVDGGGHPVGGPPGVGDADVGVVDLVEVQFLRLREDLVLQVLHLPLLLDQGRLLIGLAAVDADACAQRLQLRGRSVLERSCKCSPALSYPLYSRRWRPVMR